MLCIIHGCINTALADMCICCVNSALGGHSRYLVTIMCIYVPRLFLEEFLCFLLYKIKHYNNVD